MFRDMKWYSKQYGYSIRTIQRRIEWIKAHASRYPEDAVVYDGTKPFVREDVFEDLIRNRNNVDAGFDPVFKEAKS